MKKIKFLILIFWSMIVVGTYSVCAAATEIGTIDLPWASSISSPADLVARIGTWLMSILGALSVLGIAYSGILYITGAQGGSGDKKVAVAKKNLTWSITGLVVAILSVLIIKEVIKVVK